MTKIYDDWIAANPIRVLQDERKMSTMEVASMIGASPQIINLWRSGAATPNAGHMDGLARLFKLERAELEKRMEAWIGTRPKLEEVT